MPFSFPAAEVLETRSLLSAGAAVHAAVHAAQVATHSNPGAAPAIVTKTTIPVTAQFDGSGMFETDPASLTISPFKLQVGAHAKYSVTLSPHPGETIKGTITGTVKSFSHVGISNQVVLKPGGSLVETIQTGSGHAQKATAKPTGNLTITLNFNTGNFITLDVNYAVLHSSPPITFDFQCTA
jgi:hypothetical protein